MYKFDLLVATIPFTDLLLNGGVVPLIGSIVSILWISIRFLHYIEISHKRSFKTFFKWCASWLKKN